MKLINNKYLFNNFFYFFFFTSLVLTFFAIFFHPFVGDDYYFRDIIISYPNFLEYFKERYLNWTGRISQIILSFWVFSNDIYLLIFKILLMPLVLITFNNIIKKILNLKINFFSINFIILFVCFWFVCPSINETIFWTSGSIAYLIPLFFSIFYLGLFTVKKNDNLQNIFTYTFYLFISFLTGSSHLQVFTGCFVISSFFIYNYYKENKKKFDRLKIFYFFFIIGGIVLLISPGNFNRLAEFETHSYLSTIYKSFLFITTSIFYLGDTQSSLIFFLILMLLLFLFSEGISFKLFYDKFNFIWLVAFLVSLIAVVPAINAISTRLIFFPIFFLFIFFLKVIFYQYNLNKKFKLKNLIFYFLVILFFLESFLGSITNHAYKKENDIRMKNIIIAKENSKKYIEVSHYTIIPSRQTYMQTPEHDSNFLNEISKIYQIKIKYSDSFPRSSNIRKKIKFFFK